MLRTMAATAQQEVESLDRVLLRLATTEEANLEKVGPCNAMHVPTSTEIPNSCQEQSSSLDYKFGQSQIFLASAGFEQIATYCTCTAEVSP